MLPHYAIASGAIIFQRSKENRKIRNGTKEKEKVCHVPGTRCRTVWLEWYGYTVACTKYAEYPLHDKTLATFDNGVWLVLV